MAYAIFGDSYVSRLQKFTNGNLSFRQNKCKFYGVPGMSTRNKISCSFDRICADRPRYVFVILGGNSINRTTTPREIFEELKTMVDELMQCGVERVFVGGIIQRGKFPSWTGMNISSFNKVRKSVNAMLKKHLGRDYIDIGKRIKFPTHFDKDMVHPGVKEGGMMKLQCVIQAAFTGTVLKSSIIKT